MSFRALLHSAIHVPIYVTAERWVPVAAVGTALLFWLVFFDALLPASVIFPVLFRLSGCTGGGGGGDGDSGGDSGDSSGGSDVGCEFSSPFLTYWDGKRYRFENDVLFGAPSSFSWNLEEGKRRYENGEIFPDLYKLQNEPAGGALRFQLKEVEPEESAIDSLELLRVTHAANQTLITDASYGAYYIFDNHALQTRQGVKNQQISLLRAGRGRRAGRIGRTSRIWRRRTKREEVGLRVGDAVEVSARVDPSAPSAFFLVGARYRDWTAGELPEVERYLRARATPSPLNALARFAPVPLVLVALGLLSVFGHWKTFGQAEYLSEALNPPRAHAEHPQVQDVHSLIVEFWNWTTRAFERAEIIQPRYYRENLEAVELPRVAVREDGEVRIRVYATKRHNIGFVSFLAPPWTFKGKEERAPVSRAYHHRLQEDFAGALNSPYSREYMHTVPADTVDISFDASGMTEPAEGEDTTFLLRAGGTYAPANEEAHRLAGDWVSKLEPEAREWLKEMYSLREYHTTV